MFFKKTSRRKEKGEGTFDEREKKRKRVSETATVGRLSGCLLEYYDSVNQVNEG